MPSYSSASFSPSVNHHSLHRIAALQAPGMAACFSSKDKLLHKKKMKNFLKVWGANKKLLVSGPLNDGCYCEKCGRACFSDMFVCDYHLENVYCAPSKVAGGTGLFASVPIYKGDIIGLYWGKIYSQAEFDEHYNHIDEHGNLVNPLIPWSLGIENGIIVDGTLLRTATVWCNSSDNPNTFFSILDDGRPYVVAYKDIGADEEITAFYNICHEPIQYEYYLIPE